VRLPAGRPALTLFSVRRCFFAFVPVVALCSAAAVALAAGPGGSAEANRAAARADAVKLVSRLRLPPGATESSIDPTGGSLASPLAEQRTPNVVDRHQWWTVSGSPDSVLQYISAHRPRGSQLRLTMGGQTQGVGYYWPPVPGVLATRALMIEVVQIHPGLTGLRADAQDVWIIPRPASERIPAQETRLRVTVTRFEHRLQGPLTFTSSRRLEHVITLLNSLPRGQPGVRSCPGDPGRLIRLVFTGPGGRAVAIFDPGGCESVALILHGKPQPILATWPIPGHPHADLEQLLQRDLGVKFARY
jgi:hypothetical protein